MPTILVEDEEDEEDREDEEDEGLFLPAGTSLSTGSASAGSASIATLVVWPSSCVLLV